MKRLHRLPGPGWRHPDLSLGHWGHCGQRGQRAAREPAAGHCGTGPAGPPQADGAAALGANMLGCPQPDDAQERGAPGPAHSGPEAAALPARRAPVARRLELPAALSAVARRHPCRPSGNRARRVLGQLGDTLPRPRGHRERGRSGGTVAKQGW